MHERLQFKEISKFVTNDDASHHPPHQRVPGVCCAHAYIMPVVNTFILNKFKWTIKRERGNPLGQVRSGQVKSECLACTFRASCCSRRLSRAQGKKKRVEGVMGGGGGDRLHWRVQGSASSPTGVGSRRRVF